ncbi:hypothetical protein HPB50_004419 [Hyalomma asiaticum]|uniref:Uncharacterized protein n=1 Tax=Hyalomma asiaticum TaxID=266040 RepID=A0ACB7TAU8_HYAAI|nr:hypothetical protein HPB50_004419 [Hyalomma asiaticum]
MLQQTPKVRHVIASVMWSFQASTYSPPFCWPINLGVRCWNRTCARKVRAANSRGHATEGPQTSGRACLTFAGGVPLDLARRCGHYSRPTALRRRRPGPRRPGACYLELYDFHVDFRTA